MNDFLGQEVIEGNEVVFIGPAPLAKSLVKGVVHHVTDKSIVVTYVPFYHKLTGTTENLARPPYMVMKVSDGSGTV